MSGNARGLKRTDCGVSLDFVNSLAIMLGIATRTAMLLLTIACAVSLSGCQDEGETIWSSEIRSPDGRWLATANTKQWGGPGTAYVATIVYLKLIDSPQPPTQVLLFSNESAYPIGSTGVHMEWLTPKHLNVTYGSHATLDFQAIKCAGIDISAVGPSTELPSQPAQR